MSTDFSRSEASSDPQPTMKYDPYAPPTTGGVPVLEGERFPSESAKWVLLAVVLVVFAINVLALFPSTFGFDLEANRAWLIKFEGYGAFAVIAIAAYWIERSWSTLPMRERGDVTPGSAVFRFLVPAYNVWWLFDCQLRVCFAINRLLDAAGDERRAPRALAGIAGLLQLANIVAFFLGVPQFKALVWASAMAGWITYMFLMDPLRRAVIAYERRAMDAAAAGEEARTPATLPS